MALRTIYVSIAVVAIAAAGLASDQLLTSNAVPTSRSGSGVVTAGNSKTACIYTGSSTWAMQLRAAENATGMKYNCIETFSTAEPTWSDWATPWVTESFGIAKWLLADRASRTIILTQQLIPDSVCTSVCGSPLKWEEVCAAGQYDNYAKQLARRLISTGLGSSVIRLGAEMNGSWENDYAGTSRLEQRDWAKCFAEEVESMRGVRGAHFLFDWNVNACTDNDLLANLYPGNSFVDIIGVDSYDTRCFGDGPAAGSATAFAHLAAEPDGLNAVTSFATARGKPMSIPEWGSVAANGSDKGDAGQYVLGIHRYVVTHDVAFQSYFDNGNGGVLELDSDNPKTLAAYIASFG